MPAQKRKRSRTKKSSALDSDWEELIASVDKINPDLRPIERYRGFDAGYIREIIAYEDGSNLYRFNDNVEIISNRFGAAWIRGEFISAKELTHGLVYTYEDEVGLLTQVNTADDIEENRAAITKILENEKRLSESIAASGTDVAQRDALKSQSNRTQKG